MNLATLPKPFFVLAPMDDVTDTVFRQIIGDCASPDLFFTEFVSADGLQSPGRERVLKKLAFTDKEKPLFAQIWGKDPENFCKTASELVGMGFAGIDINMGCPQKTVVKNGCCSALINNRELASRLIKATQDGAAGRIPVSVKTRVGFSAIDLSWIEFLLGHNLSMLTIHGRTRKEKSKVPVHWDVIGRIKELRDQISPQTKLVGNGDIKNRKDGLHLAEQYGLDGIMIGRGVFQDPFVFAKNSTWDDYKEKQRIELFKKHIRLFADTWSISERHIATLNKFCKVYINGFEGAVALRSALMLAESTRELLDLLDNHEKASKLVCLQSDRYDGLMSKAIKAIVFDADGTLLDTRELILEGYKTVLRKHGLEHLATDHYIRQRLGKPVPETYEQILAGHNTPTPIEVLAAEHDEVQNKMTNLIKPYPHTEAILRRWKDSGIKLCLFTSGNLAMIERNFAGANLPNPQKLFDAIVTANDGLARKPEPDSIIELLRRVNVEPQNAVVVGDHGYDMIAASQARVGLKVGILHGFGTTHELMTSGADFLASNLTSMDHLMNFATD